MKRNPLSVSDSSFGDRTSNDDVIAQNHVEQPVKAASRRPQSLRQWWRVASVLLAFLACAPSVIAQVVCDPPEGAEWSEYAGLGDGETWDIPELGDCEEGIDLLYGESLTPTVGVLEIAVIEWLEQRRPGEEGLCDPITTELIDEAIRKALEAIRGAIDAEVELNNCEGHTIDPPPCGEMWIFMESANRIYQSAGYESMPAESAAGFWDDDSLQDMLGCEPAEEHLCAGPESLSVPNYPMSPVPGDDTFRCDRNGNDRVDSQDMKLAMAYIPECDQTDREALFAGPDLTREGILNFMVDYIKRSDSEGCELGMDPCGEILDIATDLLGAPPTSEDIEVIAEGFRSIDEHDQGIYDCFTDGDNLVENPRVDEGDPETEQPVTDAPRDVLETCPTGPGTECAPCIGHTLPGVDPCTLGTPCEITVPNFPVDWYYGDKIETAVDMVVPLVGDDFKLVRTYRSRPITDSDDQWGLIGNIWTAQLFTWVELVGSSPVHVHVHAPGSTVVFDTVTGSAPDQVWATGGAIAQRITKASVTVPNGAAVGATPETYAVWRLNQPGQWDLYFYREPDVGETTLEPPPDGHEGLPILKVDAYGTRTRYRYETYGSSDHARLQSIIFERYTGAAWANMAEVLLAWNSKGHLANAYAIRRGSPNVLTNKVKYHFKTNGDGNDDAVGDDFDLIDVRTFERVDRVVNDGDVAPMLEPWRTSVTQYRYHTSGLSEGFNDVDADGDGFIDKGIETQLKMVIHPEQIEYFAQSDDSVDTGTLEQAANYLMTLEDGDTILTDKMVVDLAAKVIFEWETSGQYRVLKQAIQSACGCAGSSQGTELRYSYTGHTWSGMQPYVQHTKIEELTRSGGSTSAYRTYYLDFIKLDATGEPIIANIALEDTSGQTSRKWMERFEYDETDKVLVRKLSTSVFASYTPSSGTGTPSTFTEHGGNVGLVREFEYNGDNRLIKEYVLEGRSGTPALVQEITYGNGSGDTRKHLPTSIKRYRVEGSTADDNTELTTFTYGFDTTYTDAIRWMTVSSERELEAENGPGGTSDTHTLFDAHGNMVWVRQPDGALSKFTYDGTTGLLTQQVANAPTTGLTSPWPGSTTLTTSGWTGRNGSGGSVTFDYTRDALGRVISTEGPGGVTASISREMRPDSLRPGLHYYTEVMLPHVVSTGSPDTYSGPASIIWHNAAGAATRRSDYEVVDHTSDLRTDYELAEVETARSAVEHHVNGLVSSSLAWPDLVNRSGVTDAETYTYNQRGQRETVTSPNGTITRVAYDVRDRVIEVEVGTNASGGMSDNMTTVAEYFYDGGGSAAQGTGDGNLTCIKELASSSSGQDRVTRLTYDYRNRLVMVENPLEPHSFTVYDNLDRVIEELTFEGTVPGSTTFNTTNFPLADRVRHTKTFFGQRGLPYKSALMIDPTSGSPTYLENHLWFDENGRAVAEWGPSAPARKTVYDGLGRAVTVYLTDRHDDAAPGDAGNHPDALSVADDHVIEQVTYRYLAESTAGGGGQIDLITRLQRLHDYTLDDVLTAADSIATYSGRYYDAAGRMVSTVEFGTNHTSTDVFAADGPAPDLTDPLPNWAIVRSTLYDEVGRVLETIDPEGIATRYIYDSLYRRVAVIENFEDAVVDWVSDRWSVVSGLSADDTDRVTSFTYDPSGNVKYRIAHLPPGMTGSETTQVTHYQYNAVISGSNLIASNDLLSTVQYPDESTSGAVTTTAEYAVEYTYNRLGEVIAQVDQNGVPHTYTRDNLGRITSDAVPDSLPDDVDGEGSDVDEWADAIEYVYLPNGLLEQVLTKKDSTVLNEIRYGYDELLRLEQLQQNPAGAVGSSHSADIDYAYTTNHITAGSGTKNVARLLSMSYPLPGGNRTVLTSDYGSGSSLDDLISRPASLSWNAGSTTHVHAVQYVGMGMPVLKHNDQPNIALDRVTDHITGAVTAETYSALDRFGWEMGHTTPMPT